MGAKLAHNPGEYLSPAEFNEAMADEDSALVDCRNSYEWQIGRFEGAPCPSGRQFTDWPKEASALAGRLQGKRVLMYCTGGIRCEMASSYLKSLGVDRVAQLHGGIHVSQAFTKPERRPSDGGTTQEYLKAYPDGGRFRGKNFVFDERIAIPSNDATVVGRCRVCSRSFDDYSQKRRCVHCRILLVCCDTCHDAGVPLVCGTCKHSQGDLGVNV